MKKKLDENDLVSKWPPVFREGIVISHDDLGIIEVSNHGETEISEKDMEQMRKLGYKHYRTNVYHCIPKLEGDIDSEDENDLSDFLVTTVTFRRYKAPPLENGGRTDKKVLKKTKPQQTGIDAGACDSVCCRDAVSPDNHQGDDMSL